MDSNRQDPSGTNPGSKGGRARENTLQIDWQARARAIWDVHPNLKKTIGELQEEARRIDAFTTSEYEDFRRKFNGTRPASEAHARALFQAGEFDRAGLSVNDWIADDEAWTAIAATLLPIDAISFLAGYAAKGGMEVIPTATAQAFRPQLRRLRDGNPAELELHIGGYLEFSVTFSGSEDISPVYLLAFEWSAVSRDWQIFNLVKGSQLDAASPVRLAIRDGSAGAEVPVGVQITGPAETFDLFVLGQRAPFHHGARSMLDNLGGRSIITPVEMGRLLGLLFSGSTTPDVARAAYAVL